MMMNACGSSSSSRHRRTPPPPPSPPNKALQLLATSKSCKSRTPIRLDPEAVRSRVAVALANRVQVMKGEKEKEDHENKKMSTTQNDKENRSNDVAAKPPLPSLPTPTQVSINASRRLRHKESRKAGLRLWKKQQQQQQQQQNTNMMTTKYQPNSNSSSKMQHPDKSKNNNSNIEEEEVEEVMGRLLKAAFKRSSIYQQQDNTSNHSNHKNKKAHSVELSQFVRRAFGNVVNGHSSERREEQQQRQQPGSAIIVEEATLQRFAAALTVIITLAPVAFSRRDDDGGNNDDEQQHEGDVVDDDQDEEENGTIRTRLLNSLDDLQVLMKQVKDDFGRHARLQELVPPYQRKASFEAAMEQLLQLLDPTTNNDDNDNKISNKSKSNKTKQASTETHYFPTMVDFESVAEHWICQPTEDDGPLATCPKFIGTHHQQQVEKHENSFVSEDEGEEEGKEEVTSHTAAVTSMTVDDALMAAIGTHNLDQVFNFCLGPNGGDDVSTIPGQLSYDDEGSWGDPSCGSSISVTDHRPIALTSTATFSSNDDTDAGMADTVTLEDEYADEDFDNRSYASDDNDYYDDDDDTATEDGGRDLVLDSTLSLHEENDDINEEGIDEIDEDDFLATETTIALVPGAMNKHNYMGAATVTAAVTLNSMAGTTTIETILDETNEEEITSEMINEAATQAIIDEISAQENDIKRFIDQEVMMKEVNHQELPKDSIEHHDNDDVDEQQVETRMNESSQQLPFWVGGMCGPSSDLAPVTSTSTEESMDRFKAQIRQTLSELGQMVPEESPTSSKTLVIPVTKQDLILSLAALNDSTEVAWDRLEYTLDDLAATVLVSAATSTLSQQQKQRMFLAAQQQSILTTSMDESTIDTLEEFAWFPDAAETTFDETAPSVSIEACSSLQRIHEMLRAQTMTCTSTFTLKEGLSRCADVYESTPSIPPELYQSALRLQDVMNTQASQLSCPASAQWKVEGDESVLLCAEYGHQLNASVVSTNQSVESLCKNVQESALQGLSCATNKVTKSCNFTNDKSEEATSNECVKEPLESSVPPTTASGGIGEETTPPMATNLYSSVLLLQQMLRNQAAQVNCTSAACYSNEGKARCGEADKSYPSLSPEMYSAVVRLQEMLVAQASLCSTDHERWKMATCNMENTTAICAGPNGQLNESFASMKSAETLDEISLQNLSRTAGKMTINLTLANVEAKSKAKLNDSTEVAWDRLEISFDDLIQDLMTEKLLSDAGNPATSPPTVEKPSESRTKYLLARWYKRQQNRLGNQDKPVEKTNLSLSIDGYSKTVDKVEEHKPPLLKNKSIQDAYPAATDNLRQPNNKPMKDTNPVATDSPRQSENKPRKDANPVAANSLRQPKNKPMKDTKPVATDNPRQLKPMKDTRSVATNNTRQSKNKPTGAYAPVQEKTAPIQGNYHPQLKNTPKKALKFRAGRNHPQPKTNSTKPSEALQEVCDDPLDSTPKTSNTSTRVPDLSKGVKPPQPKKIPANVKTSPEETNLPQPMSKSSKASNPLDDTARLQTTNHSVEAAAPPLAVTGRKKARQYAKKHSGSTYRISFVPKQQVPVTSGSNSVDVCEVRSPSNTTEPRESVEKDCRDEDLELSYTLTFGEDESHCKSIDKADEVACTHFYRKANISGSASETHALGSQTIVTPTDEPKTPPAAFPFPSSMNLFQFSASGTTKTNSETQNDSASSFQFPSSVKDVTDRLAQLSVTGGIKTNEVFESLLTQPSLFFTNMLGTPQNPQTNQTQGATTSEADVLSTVDHTHAPQVQESETTVSGKEQTFEGNKETFASTTMNELSAISEEKGNDDNNDDNIWPKRVINPPNFWALDSFDQSIPDSEIDRDDNWSGIHYFVVEEDDPLFETSSMKNKNLSHTETTFGDTLDSSGQPAQDSGLDLGGAGEEASNRWETFDAGFFYSNVFGANDGTKADDDEPVVFENVVDWNTSGISSHDGSSRSEQPSVLVDNGGAGKKSSVGNVIYSQRFEPSFDDINDNNVGDFYYQRFGTPVNNRKEDDWSWKTTPFWFEA